MNTADMGFLKGKVNGPNAQSQSLEQGQRVVFSVPWRCTWNDQSVAMSPTFSNEFGEAFFTPYSKTSLFAIDPK